MTHQFTLNLEELDRRMRNIHPKTVLLQLPSGLKRKAPVIAESIRNRFRCEVIISGDSCFGACDVPLGSLSLVDAVIQVGHFKMPVGTISKPVLMLPYEIPLNLPKLMKSIDQHLESPVGLLSTPQHISQVEEARNLLKKKGFIVKIGKGSRRVSSPGLLLGCDFSSASSISRDVKSFVLLGGGIFHAKGLALSTGKKVVILDPERSEPYPVMVDVEAFMKRRFAAITLVKISKNIGIIVSSKPGQRRVLLAKKLLRAIEDSGKCGEIVVMNDVTPELLVDLGFDAYVSTACPRIALDDSDRFALKLTTPIELLIALSRAKWDDYRIDEWGDDPFRGLKDHA